MGEVLFPCSISRMSDAPDELNPPRVFISYAWESVDYRRLVKSLATRLRHDGIDARLDAWHLRGITVPEFMNREVRLANKLLVVCSPQYRGKIHAMEDGRVMTGVGWEAMLINSAVFGSGRRRDQIIPVLLRGSWDESAPSFLRGLPYTDLSNPHNFESSYLELLQRLKGHDEEAPQLGPLAPELEPEPVEPLRGKNEPEWQTNEEHDSNSGQFSLPISTFLRNSNYLQKLDSDIKKLTDEQYVVLDFLKHERRVLISGSAGSGKTLVAAEKAIRLSKASLNVLFLCHNPQLALYVRRELTAGTEVNVADFGAWVRELSVTGDPARTADWTHYDEPDDAALAGALESLSAGNIKYDAIIVDEGQDFRDEWWAVVEAGLRPEAFFYIFHDDNQSLLPRRASYPKIGPHIDLSRNCRNAGQVFRLMRCFARTLPERKLSGGSVFLLQYRSGEEQQEISKILADVFRQDAIHRTVVLWAGPEPVDQSPFANCEITVSKKEGWRKEVIRQFVWVQSKYDSFGLVFPPGGAKGVEAELAALSDAPYPSQADLLRVQSVAKSFGIRQDVRSKLQPSQARLRRPFHWVGSGASLALQSGRTRRKLGAELVLFFQRNDWNEGIPKPTVLHITPHYAATDRGSIPLYSVPDFKGLESDIVIFCIRGRNLAQKEFIYVGISRARAMLVILADDLAVRDLPPSFDWDYALARRGDHSASSAH